jgi:hypothetical protein
MREHIPFMERLRMAWRLLVDSDFAGRVRDALNEQEARKVKTIVPPERVHASALLLLAGLQREGRLIDFLQQDVAGYGDDEVGAAARVVHGGCRKVVQSQGFDAQRIRLTGNVNGQPPFKGTLTHHGWVANEVRMPAISEAMDPRVIAPAEVELG